MVSRSYRYKVFFWLVFEFLFFIFWFAVLVWSCSFCFRVVFRSGVGRLGRREKLIYLKKSRGFFWGCILENFDIMGMICGEFWRLGWVGSCFF